MLAGLLCMGAQAQSWPAKPVRVIVPFPPGGASDTLARTVAQKMGEQTGQTFVIENKPGAASTIGIAEAAKAQADGYTILLAAAPFVITQYVYPRLSYDVQKDFVPLGLLQTTPLVLVTHPALGLKTPAEFLRAAKASPGKMNYATPGAGSLPHLVGELFKQQAGIDLLHVPYKGRWPAVADLLAGHVNSAFLSPIEIQAHVKAGKMVALASTAPKRTSGPGRVADAGRVRCAQLRVAGLVRLRGPRRHAARRARAHVRATGQGLEQPRHPRQDRADRRRACGLAGRVRRTAQRRACALGTHRQGRQHHAELNHGTMAPTRPNVLWYCADQQRWDTIHALGNSHIRTDALDALRDQRAWLSTAPTRKARSARRRAPPF
jgi:tripartite-type tricarboxylate transporter receptor subunit TctC